MSRKYTFDLCDTKHYVYVIHTSPIAENGLPIIKYGRTSGIANRFKGYPKSSVVLYLCRVKDSCYVENNIFTSFKEYFKQETYYGREYFSGGSIREMINLVDQLITFMNQRLDEDYEPIINSYNNYVTFKISSDDELNDYLDSIGKKLVSDDSAEDLDNESIESEGLDEKTDGSDDPICNIQNKRGVAKYICQDCDKSFTRKTGLNYHIQHKACKDKTHKCKYCDATFTSKSTMYRHMRLVCKMKAIKSISTKEICDRLTKLETNTTTLCNRASNRVSNKDGIRDLEKKVKKKLKN